jgi:hypothetical protein
MASAAITLATSVAHQSSETLCIPTMVAAVHRWTKQLNRSESSGDRKRGVGRARRVAAIGSSGDRKRGVGRARRVAAIASSAGCGR